MSPCSSQLRDSAKPQLIFRASGNGIVYIPLGEDLLGEYTIEQNGLLLEGIVKLKTLKGKDSSESKFSGSVREGIAYLKGTKFNYKTGPVSAEAFSKCAVSRSITAKPSLNV